MKRISACTICAIFCSRGSFSRRAAMRASSAGSRVTALRNGGQTRARAAASAAKLEPGARMPAASTSVTNLHVFMRSWNRFQEATTIELTVQSSGAVAMGSGQSAARSVVVMLALILSTTPAAAADSGHATGPLVKLLAQVSAEYAKLEPQSIRPAEGFIKYDYLVPAGYYGQMWDWDGFFIGCHLANQDASK